MRKGEGVMERGENHGSEGGVLGPRHSLWVVVVGIHRRSWWWALDLPSVFLSWRDMAIDGRGRGDMESASCQPPVGGQRWWCWVSGVGGNRRGEVAYRIHMKRRRCRCPSSVCIAWLPCCIQRCGPAHLWGGSWLWGRGVQFSCRHVPVIAFGCSRY